MESKIVEELPENIERIDPINDANNLGNDPKKVEKHIIAMGKDVERDMPLKSLREKYTFLYKSYPALFDMIAKGKGKRLDYIPMVKNMLNRVAEIQTGKITKDKASQKIGFDLAQKYIYSKIDMDKEVDALSKNKETRK